MVASLGKLAEAIANVSSWNLPSNQASQYCYREIFKEYGLIKYTHKHMCTYIYLIHNIYGKKDPGTSFSRGERQKNQMSRDFQIAIMRHNMGLSHNNILTDNFLLSWLLLFISFSWPYCSAFIFLMASSYSSLYHIYILYVFSSIICRYMCMYSIPYFLHFR